MRWARVQRPGAHDPDRRSLRVVALVDRFILLPYDLILRLLVLVADLLVIFQLSNLQVRGSDKSTCSLDLSSVIFLLLAPLLSTNHLYLAS